ncbi:MAG: hypothetical protein R3B82_29705 [Sandaracinaceae bacterium]
MSKPINVEEIDFSGLLAAYERAHGAERRAELEREVAEPVRAALASGEILAAGWYPTAWYDALLRAVEAEQDEGAIKALAGDAVTHDFQTLFRVVRLFLRIVHTNGLSPPSARQVGLHNVCSAKYRHPPMGEEAT